MEYIATQIILGCDYCDKHVEINRPRQRIVELADTATENIIRKPAPRAKDATPLPEQQEFETARHRSSSNKCSMAERGSMHMTGDESLTTTVGTSGDRRENGVSPTCRAC